MNSNETKAAVVNSLNSVIQTLETDGLNKGLVKIKADRDALQKEVAEFQYTLILTLEGKELHRMEILGKNEINIKDIARNSAKVFSAFSSQMTTKKWTETTTGFLRDYGNLTKMELIRKA